MGVTEAVVVSIIVNVALIIVALINNGRLNFNAKKLDEVKRKADEAVSAAVVSANEVSGQFKNNGGSTIKDQLDRIENRFLQTSESLNLLQEVDILDRKAAALAHKEIYSAIEAVAKTVAGHRDVMEEGDEPRK